MARLVYVTGNRRLEKTFKSLDDALAFGAVAEVLNGIVAEELDTGVRIITDPELHELLRPIQEVHARIQADQALRRVSEGSA
jgi:hypothetical protein